jgi:hypothetical protein
MATITDLTSGMTGAASMVIINDNFDNLNAALGSGAGASLALDNLASVAINTALLPGTSDSIALGSATKMWSDIFLGSGAVINFNNGNMTMTHSADNVVFSSSGGTGLWTFEEGLRVGAAGLYLKDPTESFHAILNINDALTSGAFLNIKMNDNDRTVNLGSSLTIPADPNADRILFWDDSAGVHAYLEVGSGLSLTDTTITATGSGGGITWSEVTGTSQAGAVNSGYIANNAALVTVTLPTTAAVGDVVRVAGKGAGLWKVGQNASEMIHFGNLTSTTGTGGSLTATHRRDCVELICVVADTEWVVLSSVGNITVT